MIDNILTFFLKDKSLNRALLFMIIATIIPIFYKQIYSLCFISALGHKKNIYQNILIIPFYKALTI